MNLALKICILISVVLSIGAFVVIKEQSNEIKQYFRQSTEEPLTDFAVLLASAIENKSIQIEAIHKIFEDLAKTKFSTKIYDFTKNNVDLRLLIYDVKGKVVLDSRNNEKLDQDYSQWRDVAQALKGFIGSRTSRDDPMYPDESVFYISVPLNISANSTLGALTIAKPAHNSNLFVEKAKDKFITYGVSFFAVLLSLILFSVVYFTLPIRKLTKFALSVAENKSPKLPYLPKDEIGTLGTALQKMRKSLEGKDYIEKYVRTVTHEMKSPITGIKAAAEIIPQTSTPEEREKFSDIILDEAKRLHSLVDNLALLSNIQSKELLLNESIDLGQFISEIIDGFKSLLMLNNLKIETAISDSCIIKGNSFWLKKAFINIIQNAVEFSAKESSIQVKVFKDIIDLDRKIIVQITNYGAEIPDWALIKIYDPFFSLPRPGTNQRSSGLGLTLVKEIVENHSGVLKIENLSTEGGNLTGIQVRITL